MKRLLIVTHEPSPNLQSLARTAHDAALAQAEAIEVERLLPLECQPEHILRSDALLLGTCENLGALAGLTKDLFDRCYYPVLEENQGMPIAAYIRAGHDGTGAARQLKSITTGLRWRWTAEPLVLRGAWAPEFAAEVADLAAGLTIGVEQGIF